MQSLGSGGARDPGAALEGVGPVRGDACGGESCQCAVGAHVTAQGTGKGGVCQGVCRCVRVCAPKCRSEACPGAWRMRRNGAKQKGRADSGGVCAGPGRERGKPGESRVSWCS